jgi:serine/threonine protein kinase
MGVLHRDIKPSNLFLCESGHRRVLARGRGTRPSQGRQRLQGRRRG